MYIFNNHYTLTIFNSVVNYYNTIINNNVYFISTILKNLIILELKLNVTVLY